MKSDDCLHRKNVVASVHCHFLYRTFVGIFSCFFFIFAFIFQFNVLFSLSLFHFIALILRFFCCSSKKILLLFYCFNAKFVNFTRKIVFYLVNFIVTAFIVRIARPFFCFSLLNGWDFRFSL